MKKKYSFLLGLLVTLLVMCFMLIGCNIPDGNTNGKDEGIAQTSTFVSADENGNRYTLTITENTNRSARYLAQTGDSFSLIIELFNNGNYNLTLTYTGIIDEAQENGDQIVLAITINSETINITIVGSKMTIITGTINFGEDQSLTAGNMRALNIGANFSSGVYVAGNFTNADGVSRAGYWHNNTWYNLHSSNAFMSLIGNGMSGGGIAVSDTNVFVTGMYQDNSENYHIGFWINGAWNYLTPPPGAEGASISGIAVVGNNVYVSGTVFWGSSFRAGYWLNGSWHYLPDNGYANSSAFCIAASGNNFVIGGYVRDAGNNDSPTYWLNGNRTTINLGQTEWGVTISGSISNIALVDTNVHAVGSVNIFGFITPYWVNGVEQNIDNTGNSIRSITVSGSNIYLIGEYGEDYERGLLRIGGTWTPISEPHDPTLIEDIAVSTVGIIYMVGNYIDRDTMVGSNFKRTAYRWINGTYSVLPIPQGGASYWASAIAVLE